ncbi:hypothetical protein LIER_37374 [Lithospermum erythrorhizon]|uniref:Uncharacterized protein n=1 Tax=Lithospermum erythrorhizon TaxID=34254 RepID=A0AAV3PJJ2_LITER
MFPAEAFKGVRYSNFPSFTSFLFFFGCPGDTTRHFPVASQLGSTPCWASGSCPRHSAASDRGSAIRSIIPVNLVKDGSFMTAGIVALLISGEKRAKPTKSILVPLRVYLVTLSVMASICFCNKATASVA